MTTHNEFSILIHAPKLYYSCNGIFYEQLDGVSMGSSLGPVLANVILIEFENIIVNDLINSGVLKFYRRYVDDILVLMRHSDIPHVLAKFDNFDKNLIFPFDDFSDSHVHFLDLKIINNDIDIFRKTTHTSQYTHYSS